MSKYTQSARAHRKEAYSAEGKDMNGVGDGDNRMTMTVGMVKTNHRVHLKD